MRLDLRAMSVCLLTVLLIASCRGPGEEPGGDEPEILTVYSGRSESLIQPLIERFTERTGIEVQTRFGSTSEITAMLLEEGGNTPAHVFISQDAAALGALSRAGLLQPLPDRVLDRVPARFRSAEDDWVGLSGRARTVVYNTERVAPEDLPQRLEDVVDPRYRGRFGVAPTNASFQAHMALYAAMNGDTALTELLQGMVQNEPIRYPKNTPIVQAVIDGEVDWGLVNHYYLWRALKESPDAPARNYFMPGGDASSFINMAGAGVLSKAPAALQLLEFFLGPEGQRYFAEETYEYPLVAGEAPAVDLLPLGDLLTPDVNYRTVSEKLESTLSLIEASGLNRF